MPRDEMDDAHLVTGDDVRPERPDRAGRPHLVMLVSNGASTDSRVLKSAESAVAAGYRVTVVGLRSRATVAMGHHGPALIYRATLEGRHHESVSRVRRWVQEGRVDVTLPDGATSSVVLGRPRALIDRGRRLAGRLLATGVPTGRDWRSRWPFAVDYELAFLGALLELEPDLVHCHDYHPMAAAGDYCALQAGAGRRVPWVYDAHEWLPGQVTSNPEAHRGWLGVEAEYIGRADAVVTVIDEIAERLRRRHRLAVRPAVVRNAPLRRFVPMDPSVRRPLRQECGLADDTPLMVYVGGLTEARGILTMIEALTHLPGAHLAFVCPPGSTFVGRMREVASTHQVTARMHLVPYVPAESVSWYVSSASVGLSALVPSASHNAAVPTKLREYLHGRVPVVVSDLPAQAAYVREHGVGETFVPGDARSLARAVRTVLTDADTYRSRMTDELLAQHTWEKEAEELVRVWQDLLPVPDAVPPLLMAEAAPVPQAGPAQGGRVLATVSQGPVPDGLTSSWRDRVGPTLELRADGPTGLEAALRRWVALEQHADAVLLPAGRPLLGGYLPRGIEGEVAALRWLGLRPATYCGAGALLSAAELQEVVSGHPAGAWSEEFRGLHDRQVRHLRQAVREASSPAFTSSWLAAQVLDGLHWAPTVVPVVEDVPGDGEAVRPRVMVLPGSRSARETEALAGLEGALGDLDVEVLRPRGRGFDPAEAASAHVVVAELAAADSTPAVAWALGAGSVVVGSEALGTIGVPAVHAGPEDVLDRLHDLLSSFGAPGVRAVRSEGVRFARTHHTGAAAEAIARVLFPAPVL